MVALGWINFGDEYASVQQETCMHGHINQRKHHVRVIPRQIEAGVAQVQRSGCAIDVIEDVSGCASGHISNGIV